MSKVKLKKKDYLLLFKRKKIFVEGIVLFIMRHSETIIKTSAKKTVGKAHWRNYRRRRLKNILRQLQFDRELIILGIILKNGKNSFQEEKKKVREKLSFLTL